jgi:hypothetical protein
VVRHLDHTGRRVVVALRLKGEEEVENGSEADAVQSGGDRRCHCRC